MNPVIYFDNNATTEINPGVFEAMVPFLTRHHANPSSAYGPARVVREAVESARDRVAALLGCESREVVFTSCGTESDNAAISSALQTSGGRHLVVSAVEHSAIKNHAERLELQGYAVTWLPVAGDGTLTPEQVEAALRPDTALVSIMWANNETGVLFPVEEIAARCAARGVAFHTDAVQVPGKLPIRLKDTSIDYLSISGHKFHAPKGVGALYVRRRSKFLPYLIGGHQEKGRRGGTENTASIVGMGEAASRALETLAVEQTAVRALRDRFEAGVLSSIAGAQVNGHRENRLPNTTNLAFPGVAAEALILLLDREGVCASAGSACTTGSMEPSHVLRALAVPRELALGSVRFSFCHTNTDAEVDRVLGLLPGLVSQLREKPPTIEEIRALAVH
ncbi:MAG: aminotransferase class V-fold PLP-dependent enzyme [Candidatus Methylacidiphilales bacterium]|nr:aminotransferase class V-fold PLP-dependent enzyme [Candidatus Methylacidiphilales bacterium]